MNRVVFLLILLISNELFAQPAPFLRNAWTTNAAGTPVRGQDNLSVTNLGSGTNWLFYEVGPKTVARLSDVTNVVTAIGGSGGNFNVNQFQASATHTNIKSAALVTNLVSRNMTNAGSRVTMASGVTLNWPGFALQEDVPGGTTLINSGNWYTIGTGRYDTNVDIFGTNDVYRLKLSGGVPGGSILRADGNTNVVAATIGSGLSFDGTTLSASSSGETNVNGEISITNAIRFGWVFGKAGITNLLRSFQPGNGLVGTNEGTNVSLAINPAIVASQANLTAASNSIMTFVGETNFNGEVSVTNATRMGWVNDKVNITNRLRSIQAGNGITLTNEGTNIVVASTSSGATPGGDEANLQVKMGSSFVGSTNSTMDVTNGHWTFRPVFSNAVPLEINGLVGQSTNLLECKSNDVIKTVIRPSGKIEVPAGFGGPSFGNIGGNSGFDFINNFNMAAYINGVNVFALSDASFTLSGIRMTLDDTKLTRENTGVLQQGLDAASPEAQTYKGPDGSGANIGGGSIRFSGGSSTGTGAAGQLHLAISTNSTTSASTVNSLSNAVTLGSSSLGLTMTNRTHFDIVTNDFVLNQYYTNDHRRAWVSAVISMTNLLSTDVSKVALYLDQNADGGFERTGIAVRMNGLVALAGEEELSAFVQPSARFLFTNLTTGTASSTISANSSQWVKQ